jgi:hypothetical protein
MYVWYMYKTITTWDKSYVVATIFLNIFEIYNQLMDNLLN